MAYFPNGTAGLILEQQCMDCIHEDEQSLCPIANAHYQLNYEQCKDGNEKLRQCMAMLVGDDGMCEMKPLIEKFYKKKPLETIHNDAVKYKAEWK